MPHPNDSLFVCVSQYQVPTEQVREHLAAHRNWMKKMDEEGRVVASGRQTSGSGGVIVMSAKNEVEIRDILASDPFQLHGCAAYWIFGFQTNPDAAYKGRLMTHFYEQFATPE